MDLKQRKPDPVGQHNFDEEEDTLSLCDLAVGTSINVSDDSDDSFQEDQSSSFDQDLFEFFSSDFPSTNPKDNIIFCGKTIPFRGEDEEHNSVAKSMRKYSYSFDITRSTSTKMEKSYGSCKTFPEATTELEEDKYAAKKALVEGRRARSRWYLFGFGMGRYRGEMELKDIKMRQSKLSSRSLKYEESHSQKKWWSFVRILGCQSSSHANAMVKASLGLMPK